MYIDPNTGGMLFQILATLFALFSGMVLILSGKIRGAAARFFRSLRRTKSEEVEQAITNKDSQENS